MSSTSLLSRCIFVIIVLFEVLHTIEAQRCINNRYCPDGYRCCSVGGNIICCRNSIRFWSQWYIWFGVVMFFLLLFSCLVAYRRRQRLRYQQSSAAVTAAVIAQSRGTTYPSNVTGQMAQYANTPVITDAPPTYEELKIQGISSQFQEYQQKDEEAAPSVPAPPYNQAVDPEAPPLEVTVTTTMTTAYDPPAPPYPGV